MNTAQAEETSEVGGGDVLLLQSAAADSAVLRERLSTLSAGPQPVNLRSR